MSRPSRPIRTDLVVEATELWRQSRGDPGTLSGVVTSEENLRGFPLTTVEIISPQGAEQVGKPQGSYLTLDMRELLRREKESFRRGAEAVATCLGRLIPLGGQESCLVVGLGNRAVTPDAIGPRTADMTMVTRHLVRQLPEQFGAFRPVSAIATGVLGTTGLESGELADAVAREIRPDFVVAVDALTASSVERLCTTVQISNTGIIPGSGVGSGRKALNRDTLGVPVIAMGTPTVTDASALAAILGGEADTALESLLVTPKDIDQLVSDLSKVMAYGINLALQEDLTVEDVDLFLS